jgi:hypothetical protein
MSSMELTAGARLRSGVCTTEVVVVKPPSGDVDLQCGGTAMVGMDAPVLGSGTPAEGSGEGTQLGKRYVHEETGLELLCTKAGSGSLSVGDVLLGTQQAKPLPSSD